jgi:two-component system sensor histidine kinase KdpD
MATYLRDAERKSLAEDLLFIARSDDKKAHEGKLIVYFGYSAGFGKTYSMLQDALQRLLEGTDYRLHHIYLIL